MNTKKAELLLVQSLSSRLYNKRMKIQKKNSLIIFLEM